MRCIITERTAPRRLQGCYVPLRPTRQSSAIHRSTRPLERVSGAILRAPFSLPTRRSVLYLHCRPGTPLCRRTWSHSGYIRARISLLLSPTLARRTPGRPGRDRLAGTMGDPARRLLRRTGRGLGRSTPARPRGNRNDQSWTALRRRVTAALCGAMPRRDAGLADAFIWSSPLVRVVAGAYCASPRTSPDPVLVNVPAVYP